MRMLLEDNGAVLHAIDIELGRQKQELRAAQTPESRGYHERMIQRLNRGHAAVRQAQTEGSE